MPYSLTLTGLAAFIIGNFLQSTGVVVAEDQIANFVAVALQIGGAIGVYVGRVRAGGITWYGKKL